MMLCVMRRLSFHLKTLILKPPTSVEETATDDDENGHILTLGSAS